MMSFSKWLNSSFRSTDFTLTGAGDPGQSEPRSNDYERVLYISQSSRTGTSLSNEI